MITRKEIWVVMGMKRRSLARWVTINKSLKFEINLKANLIFTIRRTTNMTFSLARLGSWLSMAVLIMLAFLSRNKKEVKRKMSQKSCLLSINQKLRKHLVHNIKVSHTFCPEKKSVGAISRKTKAKKTWLGLNVKATAQIINKHVAHALRPKISSKIPKRVLTWRFSQWLR